MTRCKAIIALALAILYLPATGHCLLQQAGVVSDAGDCCEQSAPGDTPQSPLCPPGCCQIEYALYFGARHDLIPAPTAELPAAVIIVPQECAVNEAQLAAPNPSPPALLQSWQFSFRTALPPRAPSCRS